MIDIADRRADDIAAVIFAAVPALKPIDDAVTRRMVGYAAIRALELHGAVIAGLTRRQAECLRFIRSYMEINGIGPSFDDAKAALGLRSKSGVHRLILGLVERGCIARQPGRARAVGLTPLGERTLETGGAE